MKKIVSITFVMLLALGALSGCGSKDGTGNNGSVDELAGNVVIAGSTSVQPLSEELAVAFMDANPGISVEVQGGGSGQGMKAIQEKIADFGALSRNVKEEEKDDVTQEYIIAKDGIGVIVNLLSNVTDLTTEQIKKIYTGEIKNWNEVGGASGPIVVVTREEGSGTRGAFIESTNVLYENHAGKKIDKTTSNALVQGSNGGIMQTVASTPNTIGYISIGSLSHMVKAVNVEGVMPTTETVLSEEYKLYRPFLYVAGAQLSEAAQLYIDFIMSPEGQAIIEDNGFIPVI